MEDSKFITVKGFIDGDKPVRARLFAKELAKSAFDNEVTLEEFKLALDQFSAGSVSSVPQIQAWRDEATETFFKLLEDAGKLTWKATEFVGGSDYEEVNETTLGDDIKTNF